MTILRFRSAPLWVALAISLLLPWSANGRSGTEGSAPSQVVELRKPSPDWFTPELEMQVITNGSTAAPVDAPLPSEIGIRPGSWMISPWACTMNFVFSNGSKLGIGTAGHCVSSGQEVVLLTLAPGSGLPVLVNIGTAVISQNGGPGNDFALVEVRPELHNWVFPTISLIGGPCGIYTGNGPISVDNPGPDYWFYPSSFDLGDTVYWYGHGFGAGTGGTPRAGAVLSWGYRQDDVFHWAGPVAPGDSGSPVRIHNLKAAGVLTHAWLDPAAGAVGLGLGWGVRITKILSMANPWTLVNSYVVNGDQPLRACPSGITATSG